MSLSESDLATALESVFTSQGTAQEAADGMAQAYCDYASAGLFGASTPTIPAAYQTALASAIYAITSNPLTGSADSFGTAWGGGLAVFWLAVPVSGSSGGGVTAGCPGAVAAGVAVTAVVTNTNNTAAQAADGIAAALHAATITVTASLSPPMPPTVYTIA